MIENLRKYTGLIIVLFVLVIVGFIFMDYQSFNRGGSGNPYLKVNGRTYTDKEFRQFGSSSYELTQAFTRSGDYQLFSFLFSMTGKASSQEEAEKNFFAARLLLKEAKESFGIYPGEEEIDSFIRKLRVFSGPTGEFSPTQYREWIEKRIGHLGLTEADIRDLASDVLAQQKLAQIMSSSLDVDRNVLSKEIAIDSQKIELEIARLDLAPIQEKLNPSEQEIKDDWNASQEAFKTEEKRKFTYFSLKPTYPQEPAALAPLPENATPEAKAEYEKADTARTAKIAEDRRKAQLEIGEKADDFLVQLADKKSITFEELAQKNGWELKTSELFSLGEAPEEIKVKLRASSAQGTAADELFAMQLTTDPLSKISPAIAVDEDGWLIARLDEIEAIRTKTYDEAKVEARERYIRQQATSALKKAAEEAVQKIQEALTAGKSFTEASKSAGISNEILSLKEVSSSDQPDTQKAPANLFEVSKYTNAGELLPEPILEAERAFIVRVIKRELVKKETASADLDIALTRAKESNQIYAFSAWINAKLEAAGIEELFKK